jgi:amino acid adenylation domain-containing protein/non-ribosomal peptide synthase protein (TIGR01720 family)
LDLEILKRAEDYFDNPLYIHLTRHPYASIYSFVEAKLDKVFFRYENPFSQRELAELIWIISHQNIQHFLNEIPNHRQMRISFENLITTPENVMRETSKFLGIEYCPDMISPYSGDRMTSSVTPNGQMVGDFKFYLRKKIDNRAADRWKKFHTEDFLSDVGIELAEQLGYQIETTEVAKVGRILEKIELIDRDKNLPLSYAQQRLWFLDQWDPGSPYYNIPSAVRLRGTLDIHAFEESINIVVKRHEVLRTAILSVKGKPLLSIEDIEEITFPVTDLSKIPAELRENEARCFAEREVRKPFDLSRVPLIRSHLIKMGSEDHILILTLHHIAADGWSMGILIREIAAFYQSFTTGKDPEIRDLPIQYVDYAAWQKEWLEGAVLAKQMDYWNEKLENSPTLLELPTDKPRPPVQSLRGKQYYFELSESLSQGIKQLSHMEEKTLFMTLLAAFQVLLYRYSHETDMNIGTPIANRNREEIESLVGFFVNTLVLRGDLSGNPTFTELLDRVYKTTVEAYDNQDVPFEHLVDELNLERVMSHTPLFQVMFTLQEAPARTIDLTGLSIEPIELDSGTAKYDLIFTMVDRGDILRGVVEYNLDLFKGATIERFVNHFNVLLEGIIEDVEIPISNLPILTLPESDILLNQWGRGHKPEGLVQFEPPGELEDEPRRQTLHRLFERQVKLSGQSRAVVEVDPNLGENSLTYDELNKMANQLAHYLIKSGVGQNDLVGLLVERSLDLFIGILGIWKAGAAYLPLDPSYPIDRLNFMLEDAHVQILLSQMSLHGHPLIKKIHGFGGETQSDGIRTIYLDEDWGKNFGKESIDNLEIDIGGESLAYVIYTSGSTGKPKGVMIEHHSTINLWMGLSDAIYVHHPGEGLRVSLNAPLPFDASVQQLVMLLSGHTLFVIPQEVRLDGSSLLDFIQQTKLDVLDCVPSQLKLLLDAGLLENGDWKPSVLLPGGEVIDEQIWSRLVGQDEVDFFNMYGPTECSVDSTICRIMDYPDQPSIGRPILNGSVYVLDSYLRPVPVGVAGELCIGGAGVGRGYLRRPALSAEKFVPDPYSENSDGARLYRTGDLVRYRPDGYLEFLGRIDHQVKVRGFRIELGDIEATLLEYQSMKEVAVIVREDKPGEKQLVAYYVRESKPQESVESLTIGELRGFLKEKLPDFMIPSIFVTLDSMPLTPNAKIDQKALPQPEGIRPELDTTLVAPSTEVEEKLVNIWADVLGLDALGIHDNFFELGGDSILSIQIISRARQESIHLTPRDMFEAQTIYELALKAGSAREIHAEQGIVTGSVPLTPIQHYFFGQELVNPHHWNQALMLDIRSEEDSNTKKREEAVRSQFEQALQHILIHHDVLRMRFEFDNSSWTQSNVDIDEYISFEWVDMSAYEKGERIKVMEAMSADYQSTLNINTGPLIRVIYFDLGPSASSRLLFIIHHLAVDGISWRIILEDFQTAFLQLINNAQISLPQKTTSYRYWAQSLIDYSRTEEIKDDLDYWVEATKLSNPPLPLDHSIGENFEESAQNIRIVLDREDTLTLLQEVPKAYNTEITDVLLTALVVTFNKWTGANSLIVNLEGHGREDITIRNTEDVHDKMGIDISRTVGWFTSLFPIRLSAGGVDSIGEALVSIKEQLRKIPNRGFTYGILRYLSPWADELLCDIDGNKMFVQPSVSFNFLGKVDEGMINPSTAADTDRSQNLFLGLSENYLGPVHGPLNKREHLIDIISSVTNGQLRIEWIYSENYHKRETIQELADSYVRFLLEITTHCLSRESVVYTPSDFEDVDMDQEDLDAILDELGEV